MGLLRQGKTRLPAAPRRPARRLPPPCRNIISRSKCFLVTGVLLTTAFLLAAAEESVGTGELAWRDQDRWSTNLKPGALAVPNKILHTCHHPGPGIPAGPCWSN